MCSDGRTIRALVLVVVMGSPRDGGIGLSSRMCTSMQSKPRANNLRAAILRGEAEMRLASRWSSPSRFRLKGDLSDCNRGRVQRMRSYRRTENVVHRASPKIGTFIGVHVRQWRSSVNETVDGPRLASICHIPPGRCNFTSCRYAGGRS